METSTLDAEYTDYLPLESGQVTETAAPSAYLPISSAESVSAGPTPTLPISSTVPGFNSALDAESSNYQPIGQVTEVVTSVAPPSTAPPSAYLPISSTEPLLMESTPLAADPSAFLPTSSTSPSAPPPSTSTFATVQDDDQASESPASSAFLPLASATESAPPRTISPPISPASTPPVTLGDPNPSAFLPLSSTVASESHDEAVPSSDFIPLGQATTAPTSQQPSLLQSSPSTPDVATL